MLGLLQADRATSQQASSRIKRWSLFLSNYKYRLVFRNTKEHANADALSRLPLPDQPPKTQQEPELVLLAAHLSESPVTADNIRVWTRRDKTMVRVFQYIQQGWSTEGDTELEPYSSRRLELSSYEGRVLWGTHVAIPPQGRKAVFQELHEGHPGISCMKALARVYVWWPGITADIEKSVRLCRECQQVQSSPPPAPLHPWRWPTRPWARLHLGPFQGKNILVAIDTHSKWIEAVCTPSMSSAVSLTCCGHCLPDSGCRRRLFLTMEPALFKQFLRKNGVRHTTSAPYHPASNGLAERVVQIIKRGLLLKAQSTPGWLKCC